MIIIKSSNIQFKNPVIGEPTRAVKEHYNGRRVVALIDEEKDVFQFTKDEVSFEASEVTIIEKIREKRKTSNNTKEEKTRIEELEHENKKLRADLDYVAIMSGVSV